MRFLWEAPREEGSNMQIDRPDGIAFVQLTAAKVHAVRDDGHTREQITLCGRQAESVRSLADQSVDEQALCSQCRKGLSAWGFIPPDVEVVAHLRIMYSDIARVLRSQGVEASRSNIEVVALYLEALARAWAQAELQDKTELLISQSLDWA
jgi:hypothetical protein